MTTTRTLAGAALPVLLTLSACGVEPVSTEARFAGTFAVAEGGGGSIALVTVPSPAPIRTPLGQVMAIDMRGEIEAAGGPAVTIVGSYDADSGALSFASEDGSYAFFGTVLESRATGSGHAPAGRADFVLSLEVARPTTP